MKNFKIPFPLQAYQEDTGMNLNPSSLSFNFFIVPLKFQEVCIKLRYSGNRYFEWTFFLRPCAGWMEELKSRFCLGNSLVESRGVFSEPEPQLRAPCPALEFRFRFPAPCSLPPFLPSPLPLHLAPNQIQRNSKFVGKWFKFSKSSQLNVRFSKTRTLADLGFIRKAETVGKYLL